MQRLRRANKSENSGFVLVFVVLIVSTLFLFVGFAVDIGNWYLQSSKLQNAADSAALAGVVKMPDVAAAELAATNALKRNGFVDGGNIKVSYLEDAPNHLQVSLSNTNVKSIFVRPAIDHISLTRISKAETHVPVLMGTPYNVLGSGSLAMTGVIQKEPENYWLAVNGYCTSKSDGDFRLSRYDGNKFDDHTDCPDPDPTHLNPDYDPNGYDFTIQIPPGGATTDIAVYDPAYAPGASDIDVDAARNAEFASRGPSLIDTIYTIYDATTNTTPNSQPIVAPPYYAKAYDTTCTGKWCVIFSDAMPGKTYRLNVHTLAGQLKSTGANAFALWARPQTGADTCDSRVTPNTCPVVQGVGALSVLTDGSTDSTASIYMAQIAPGEAEQTINVGLFDPGEGAHYVQLIGPDNSQRPVKYSAAPDAKGLDGNNVTKVDVSGTGTQVWPYDPEPARYNDRTLTLQTRVPYNYATWKTNNNYFWKIKYVAPSGGSVPIDRTTWTLSVQDTSPAHLIPAN